MQERVKFNQDDNMFIVTIRAYCDEKKQKLLLLWIVLFSICGIAIISQFFEEYDAGTKVFFGVYVAFWLFFEFKVVYAYRWRKLGLERITVENDNLILEKSIGQRGITQTFNKTEIKKIDFYKDTNSKFTQSMNSSYWNINKYQLAVYLESEIVPFAIDLTNKDAKFLLNKVRDAIKE